MIDHAAGQSHLSLFTYNAFGELTASGAADRTSAWPTPTASPSWRPSTRTSSERRSMPTGTPEFAVRIARPTSHGGDMSTEYDAIVVRLAQ